MDRVVCKRCQEHIDAVDRFCRYCGLPTNPDVMKEFVPAQMVPEVRQAKPSPADNPYFVLFMIFFVLGPFALPILWRGNAFTLRWKWIWTILTLVYVFLLFWLLWFLMVKMILDPLRDVFYQTGNRVVSVLLEPQTTGRMYG
jgi:hypothetical protein